jgi:hypothetical protein
MIRQYLLNNNKTATVAFRQKILSTKQPLVSCAAHKLVLCPKSRLPKKGLEARHLPAACRPACCCSAVEFPSGWVTPSWGLLSFLSYPIVRRGLASAHLCCDFAKPSRGHRTVAGVHQQRRACVMPGTGNRGLSPVRFAESRAAKCRSLI